MPTKYPPINLFSAISAPLCISLPEKYKKNFPVSLVQINNEN